MAGRDDLLADLPAPHADEPPTLRQDIADELADHLKCAAQRESFKNTIPRKSNAECSPGSATRGKSPVNSGSKP